MFSATVSKNMLNNLEDYLKFETSQITETTVSNETCHFNGPGGGRIVIASSYIFKLEQETRPFGHIFLP